MGDNLMKTNQRVSLTYLLIIIAITLWSCGASHKLKDDIVYKDTDFTYNHLRNNGMIIGGISSQLINLTPEERLKYSSILSNVFLEKLKGAHNIRVITTEQFIDQIGKGEYLEIMNYFDREKTIQRETVQSLRDTLPDVKYIVFAYIENENVIDYSLEEYVEKEEGKKEIETEYQKTYLLTIEFQMFDIIQEKLVLNNIIHNESKKSETRTTRTGCFESCFDQVVNSILFGEPAEISREEVLAKISEQFAKDLAKI